MPGASTQRLTSLCRKTTFRSHRPFESRKTRIRGINWRQESPMDHCDVQNNHAQPQKPPTRLTWCTLRAPPPDHQSHGRCRIWGCHRREDLRRVVGTRWRSCSTMGDTLDTSGGLLRHNLTQCRRRDNLTLCRRKTLDGEFVAGSIKEKDN